MGLFVLAVPLIGFALANDYNPQSVGAGNPEVHIKSDVTMSLKSSRVTQIAGSTLYLNMKWGVMPMYFIMKTDAKTAVTKRYGGMAKVADIKVGDYLDIEGDFFAGSDFFGINALSVKDWSLQEESGTFAGVITEVRADMTFTLRTTQNPNITVSIASTSTIRKGAVTIPFDRLRKGDAIPIVTGVYDYSRNTLAAKDVLVYQTKADFTPRNFEGKLKQIDGTTLPTALLVTVNGVDYTVKLSEKTPIQKKNRSPGQLARFVVGDTVRFYGALREVEKIVNDALVVDAEIVRNLNL